MNEEYNIGTELLLPSATELRQGNVFTRICHSVHRGGGHAWWEGGMCGRGVGVDDRGVHGWGHVWQGVCIAGECVAGEMATAAAGTHPTGTHSCLK